MARAQVPFLAALFLSALIAGGQTRPADDVLVADFEAGRGCR